jgi:hypothetical protein
VTRLLLCAGLFLTACAAKPPVPSEAPAAQPRHATLFVSAELKGYLGPCGCSENMRGGIARTAAQIEAARKTDGPVLFVDSGDALFGEPTIPEAAIPQQERKAKAMAEAMKALGLSVRARGPLDDARGEGFRKSLSLPELGTDGVGLVNAGAAKVAVVEGGSAGELESRSKAAREKGAAFVLGLFRTSFEDALKSELKPGSVDLAVAVKAKDELSGELNKLSKSGVPLVQVQTKGRSLLKLDLFFQGQGNFELLRGTDDVERDVAALDQRIELLRAQVNEPMIAEELKKLRQQKLGELIARKEALIEAPVAAPEGKNAFTVRFLPIESSFPEDEKVKALVTAYDRDVGLLNVEWAKQHGQPCPEPAKGEAKYVGNAECKECHEEAFPSWQASKHAVALETLKKVGKEHHLDCVGCHVTGWQKPGGVCRIDQTAERDTVGCEMCHGPGSIHAGDPDKNNVAKGNESKTCVGCHDRENSPHFELERYLKEIIAPGHGLPMAKGPRGKKKSG